MRAALVQLTSREDPQTNLVETLRYVREATAGGAELVLTPEITNIVTGNRDHQREVLCEEGEDPTLAALRAEAKALGIWLLIGSLAIKTGDADGRFANRSFLISPAGEIAARYDKIHMFDVDVSERETHRESAAFRPGTRAVVTETPLGTLGQAICYDVRFPELFHRLAKGGAQIISVPAAFTPPTGEAHWEVLLRARAIETGSFVLAPAQTGQHSATRATYGHSLAISPWGKVLADAGTEPGVTLVDLDLSEVDNARGRIPALAHRREFEGP